MSNLVLVPLKIIVFAFDVPYPANRGGRADIWRRLVAFNKLGCDIQLVCWQNAENKPPTLQELEVIRANVSGFRIYKLKQGAIESLKRMALLPVYPSHVAARRLSHTEFTDLLGIAKTFAPDAVWIEGPYPGAVGRHIAKALGKPFYYRSHNIEHVYMQRQAHAAGTSAKFLAWEFSCVGLKRFEIGLMSDAKHVYDISSDDIKYWNQQGLSKISCLPPLPDSAIADQCQSTVVERRDVVFLGNLTTPNNMRGVEFLLTEVLPRVLAKRPSTRFTIAGSNPNAQVKKLVASCTAAELLENVPNAMVVMQSARVLVNPVRSGSGVMVKVLDMLMTDAPIVSASQGASGLPQKVKDQLILADEADSFAAALIAALDNPCIDLDKRKNARDMFSIQSIEHLVNDLRVELLA